MKQAIMTVFVVLGLFALGTGDADAARMGGGKSVGMQRQSVAPKQTATPQQATPAQQAAPAPSAPNPATAPAPAPKRNWLGPIAGLAAGLGIAALLSHFGLGEGVANVLMIALLAMAAVFVFRLLFRKRTPEMQPATAFESAGQPGNRTTDSAPLMPQAVSAAASSTATPIPADFDTESFVRVAKLNFVRLQAANDTMNLDDIREFTSPELFAEIKLQMTERGNNPQQTDVVTLNAELLEVTTEGGRHIASVRFSGLIREEAGAAAAPFDEIWNLSKPANGSGGWVVAGIQQVN